MKLISARGEPYMFIPKVYLIKTKKNLSILPMRTLSSSSTLLLSAIESPRGEEKIEHAQIKIEEDFIISLRK